MANNPSAVFAKSIGTVTFSLLPIYDCAGNASDVNDLVWTINQDSGMWNIGYPNFQAGTASVSTSGASGSFNVSTYITADNRSTGFFFPQYSVIDISSVFCNPTSTDQTLQLALSDIVSQMVDSTDAGSYCNAIVSVTINGVQTTLCYLNSGMDNTGPEIPYTSPLIFDAPSNSLTTIEINVTANRTVGVLGDIASISANFVLSLV